MRLEPERFPDPAHRRLGQSGFGGHRCPRPVRGVFGLTLQRRHDHLLDLGVGDHARRTRTWLISQPVEARLHEPPPPHPYRLRPHTNLSSHLFVGFTCRATQHDPTPLCQRLRRLRSPRPPLQRFPLLVGQHQLSYRPAPTRHAPSLQLVIEFMAQGTSRTVQHLPTRRLPHSRSRGNCCCTTQPPITPRPTLHLLTARQTRRDQIRSVTKGTPCGMAALSRGRAAAAWPATLSGSAQRACRPG